MYRARDTKLGREVAIKVLPEVFSRDEEKLARFQREARLLASVNHPNIATIHGIEESNRQQFLVMELVEGEDLAERLVSGPMPIEEVLRVFQLIAEGLGAAHEKGIVHRDLKPGNIKITPDGKPKILDFGLAKALAGEAPVQDLSQSPTRARDATESGVLLGTAPYMSPEQARGQNVDKRTDIWAFGVCLYEALTAKAPFRGDTVSDTLVRILDRDPDWEALPTETPAGLRTVLRRCLAKDPRKRLHDIADVRIELEAGDAGPVVVHAPAKRRGRIALLPWAFGAVALLWAAFLGVRRGSVPDRPDGQVQRFTLETESIVFEEYPYAPVLALSPDGRTLVYAAERDGLSRLFVRRLESYTASPIEGTDNGHSPFFSPDGEWIGFVADGQLKKIPLRGGASLSLAKVSWAPGSTWGDDDSIVFGRDEHMGLSQVSANGGPSTVVTSADGSAGESWHTFPQLLPGARAVLFTALDAGNRSAKIYVHSFDTGERRFLLEGGNARYVATGHLVFPKAGSLWAVRFDPVRLEVSGDPVLVVGDLMMEQSISPSLAHFAISGNGTLAYVTGDAPHGNTMVWVSRDGDVEPITETAREHFGPRLSPDGRQVAVRMPDERGQMHVWTYDFARDSWTRLTTEKQGWWPVWAPDGSRLRIPSSMTIEFRSSGYR